MELFSFSRVFPSIMIKAQKFKTHLRSVFLFQSVSKHHGKGTEIQNAFKICVDQSISQNKTSQSCEIQISNISENDCYMYCSGCVHTGVYMKVTITFICFIRFLNGENVSFLNLTDFVNNCSFSPTASSK